MSVRRRAIKTRVEKAAKQAAKYAAFKAELAEIKAHIERLISAKEAAQ